MLAALAVISSPLDFTSLYVSPSFTA
ncbi:hypothetical protein [Bacteroides uniformis]